MLNYDEILLKIGEFGKWQRRGLLLLFIPAFVGGMVVLTTAFTAKVPKKFVCHEECDEYLPSRSNFEDNIDNILSDRVSADNEETKNCLTVPLNKFDNDSCGVKDENIGNKTEVYCDSSSNYVFNHFGMKSSVITDNYALCMGGVDLYKTICDSFFMLGYFVGGFFFGLVADTRGRKVSVCLAIFFAFIGTGLGPLPYLNHHWVYAVLRIIPGAGSVACYLMAFTLSVEIIGKKEQFPGIPWNMTIFSFVGNIIAIPFAFGEATNGLLAFIFESWDTYQFSVTFICGVSLIIWFFLPESPRWLIEEGRFEEASKLIKVAAKTNGKELTDEDLNIRNDSAGMLDRIKDAIYPPVSEDKTSSESHSLASSIASAFHDEVTEGIFHPVLFKSTMVLFMIWTVVSLIYYGTSFGIEELHLTKNPYLAVGIVALVEIPSYLLTALVMDATGRKPLLILTLLITGLSSLVAAMAEKHSFLSTVMILIAKFGISSTFTVSRIYTSELYPTHMRATALGACKSVSCVGAIAAPWIGEYLPRSWKHGMRASLIIYAICAGLPGVLSFLLADTVGFPLPSTLEDVQKIIRLQKPMLMIATPDWDPLKNENEKNGDLEQSKV